MYAIRTLISERISGIDAPEDSTLWLPNPPGLDPSSETPARYTARFRAA